jgi:hypothetical protein
MCAAATVATVGAGFGVKLCTSEMLAAGPAMTTFAKNSYVINEIFFHEEMQR